MHTGSRPKRRHALRLVLVAAIIGVALVPGPATAGGFEYGPQGLHAVGRGGAFVVKADDPSAIYWNPGKLALLRGTRLIYNHNFTDGSTSFDRDGSGGIAFQSVSEQSGFFPLGASLVVTSDFGLDDWAFGFGMQGPPALGEARFPSMGVDAQGDPRPETGASRYGFLKQEVALVHFHLAAAWKYEELFGIGASLQYVLMPWLRYSLVMVGPVGVPPTGAFSQNDLRADLDMMDTFNMTATIGAWARPLPFLELAVSARVVPVDIEADGDVTMKGTPGSVYVNAAPVVVPATLSFTYPVTVMAGVRYFYEADGRELFDVEVDFVWEQWSALDAFRVNFQQDELDVFGTIVPLEKITLQRDYQDTYSVRLGGEWNPIQDTLWVRLGGWWESGAQKSAYTLVDFPSFHRFGIGVGISAQWHGVELGISYAHVFQLARDVAAGSGRVYPQIMTFDGTLWDPQSGDPLAENVPAVNEGHYEGSYDILTVGLGFHFDELFR